MTTTVHGDGYYTYLWARTLVFDGDMSFYNDYRQCPDPWNLRAAPIAQDVNYWNLGAALFWVPILAIDRLVQPRTLEESPETLGCHGPLAERAVRGSALAGLLAVLCGFLVARRRFGDGPAMFGAAAIGLLTGLTYYATTMLSYGHAASSAGAGLALLAWDRLRQTRTAGGWALMGAALGLAMLMRAQNAIVVLLPLTTWLVQASQHLRQPKSLLRHCAFGVFFTVSLLIVFAPQMGYWYSVSGSPLTVPQGEHYMRWGHPRMWRVLFSNSNGLFTWAPVMYLALAGWLLMLRRSATRSLGIGLLTLFVANTYVVGSVYDWWGSIGFPGRRFDTIAVPSMIGVAALAAEAYRWSRARAARTALALAVLVGLLGIFWNTGVMRALAKNFRTDTAQTALAKWNGVFNESAGSVWRAVGNPLSFPASLPFAAHHGVHPNAWDAAGGQDFFYHDHQTLERRPLEGTIMATDAELNGLFSPHAIIKTTPFLHRVLPVGSSRLLLPLHYPNAGALLVHVHHYGTPARLSLRVNGIHCGTHRVTAGLHALRFGIPPSVTHHGVNTVWFWVDVAPVGVERIEVLDIDPAPSIAQRRRNAELRTRLHGRSARRPSPPPSVQPSGLWDAGQAPSRPPVRPDRRAPTKRAVPAAVMSAALGRTRTTMGSDMTIPRIDPAAMANSSASAIDPRNTRNRAREHKRD